MGEEKYIAFFNDSMFPLHSFNDSLNIIKSSLAFTAF